MHDVFVSYAREDKNTVQTLIETLQESGMSVWWDSEIHTGTRFDAMIDDALRDSRSVLVVWSDHSVDSDWVKMEAQFGLAREILLPIRISDVELPQPFHRIQTADLSNKSSSEHYRAEFERFRKDLETTIQRGALLAKHKVHGFDRAAIAVLPLVNRSRNEDDEYLADGITEDIIARLQRFKTFPVISRHSTFTYKNRADDLYRIGEELGATYIVTGSVHVYRERIRVAVELIELPSLEPLWSEKFSGELEDIFDLQDEISLAVAAKLEPEIERRERAKTLPSRNESLQSWDLVRRGMYHQHKLTKQDAATALDYFNQALEVEPESVEAILQKAWWYFWDTWVHQSTDGWEDMEALARQGYALEPQDSRASMIMGIAVMMHENPYKARPMLVEAQKLNPSNAWVYAHLGTSYYLDSEPEKAIQPLNTALQLSPFDLFSFHAYGELAVSQYMLGNWQDAIDAANASLRVRPGYWYAQVMKIGALARSDNLNFAKAELEALLERRPDFDRVAIDWLMFTDKKWNEYIIEGLVMSGWETV